MANDLSGNGVVDVGRGPTTEQMAAAGAFAITPSDDAELASTTRGIYVGGAGNVAVQMLNGAIVTFTAPPIGTILPIQVNKVMATNTTATLLIGLI